MNNNNIIDKFLSGFRKNHSTDTCLSYLSDKILSAFDKGLFTGMILIDLQKAFDTIDHKKNRCLGFSYSTIARREIFVVNIENIFLEQSSLMWGSPRFNSRSFHFHTL